MSHNVTLKIDGVSMGEIIGLTGLPTWTIKSNVISNKKPIANSKKTNVDVKEFGTDIITADVDIDNSTYPYRIQIMKRLQDLKELYKGEKVSVSFEQNTGSSTETLTFDNCLCVTIDSKVITDGAGGTLTFKFEYGNTNMKIDQILNGTFLLPNGTSYQQAKNWTHTGGASAKRTQTKTSDFAVLLYRDGSTNVSIDQTTKSDSDASSDYVVIFKAEMERVDNQEDYYTASAWDQTSDVDSEVTASLSITRDATVQAIDNFVFTKNSKSIVCKTACELAASKDHKFKLELTAGTGAIIIKRAWLEVRKADEC